MNLTEQHIEEIVRDYYKQYGFVRHQLDTYNTLINEGIQGVISSEPPIVMNLSKDTRYTVKFGNIYIPKASLIEEDRSIKHILPREARDRNITYDTPIYVDITEIFEREIGSEWIITETISHKRQVIARLPVMIRSCICNLYDMTEEERVQSGECYKDPGGYFIIKGHERTLVGQVRGLYNNIMVLKQKSGDKYAFSAEIRSISEETGHSVVVQCKVGSDDRTLVFSLPYIKEAIPVGIVFKALGFLEDKDMYDFIGLISETSDGISYKKYMDLIIRDSFFIKTKDEALSYIGQYAMHVIKESETRDYAWQVVETELFPHLGITTTIKEKAFFAGHMVNKLLRTYKGQRSEDDKDNYTNKRVEMSGVLCCNLFRTLFKRYTKSIAIQLENKKQRPDVITAISRLNSITMGLAQSFATGRWGVPKNTYVLTGVSQILSRLTYGATLSNLRRIILPIGKEAKNTKIRQIHTSQMMFICPAETPEGQSAGLVLNLALQTIVSQKIPTIVVKEILEVVCKSITYLCDCNDTGGSKVFLNGIFIGIAADTNKCLAELRYYRKIGLIHPEISISYDTTDNEIKIYSDEGRLLRPVFSVEDEQLTLLTLETGLDWDKVLHNKVLRNKYQIEGINDGVFYEDIWDTLIGKGCIKYIDNYEAECSVIAMSQDELREYHNDYCEIMPATMLGVMASIIPFPDHSQSPRNCYQASMGKQAIGVFATSYCIRNDTVSYVLDYPQKPLVSTISADIMGFNDMPSGINAIVAIATYGGFNQEDSVILNGGSVDRGLFSVTSYHTLVEQETRKSSSTTSEKICIVPGDKRRQDVNYNFLDNFGIVKRGTIVGKGMALVGKIVTRIVKKEIKDTGDKKVIHLEEEISDCSLVAKHGDEGVVDRILKTTTPNGYKLVKIIIRRKRIPEIGDKFASREAQKGTCGMIYKQEDMPFSSTGMTPDIIINPHCIPGRMTINQLMECVLGKTCTIMGKFGDATPFSASSVDIVEKLCADLGKCGFQSNGNETLYNGMTGEMLNAQIFMGPTYYQRLKHMVSDKIHGRAQGPVTTLTHQPSEGRSRDGGLRFGEMERDCMITHGTSRFLRERLFDQSDPFQVLVCGSCGFFVSNPNMCKNCGSDQPSKCNLPYAAKLLLQELNAMGIKTTITTKQ